MISDQRLYAVVFKMAAIRRGAVPADHGKQALSALYALLKVGDETLAKSLHDDNIHKPFTVSLICSGKTDREGAQHFSEGDSAEWRFTLLRDPAFEALIQRYVQSHRLPHVRIGAMQFAITDAFVSGSHPNSGYVSLEKLAEHYSDPPESYARTVGMNFLTPTAFHLRTDPVTRRRRLRIMPDPRTLFSTLRKRWVTLGGADPGDEFDQWVAQTVELEPLHLKWSSVRIEKATVRGFTGSVRFHHWGTDTCWLPFLHLLTDLTFYTGVGYQTTRGMGQVRPYHEPPQED